MSLDDIRLREELDLEERVDDLQNDIIPELDHRIEAAEAQQADGSADDPEQSAETLRNFRETLQGKARACERVNDALDDDAVFVLQELMTQETSLLTDDVSERSVDVDYEREEVSGSPKQGYHKVRTLELAVVDGPDDMETKQDRKLGREVYCIGKLPDHVTDYLYECAVALNDAGSVDGVGNLSGYGVTFEPSSSDDS